MMLLKPYISLQKYQLDELEDHSDEFIFYLGVTVFVPDGHFLYLGEPEVKAPDGFEQGCTIPLWLFKTTAHRHHAPQEFILNFDQRSIDSVYKNVTHFEVEIKHIEHKARPGDTRPILDQQFSITNPFLCMPNKNRLTDAEKGKLPPATDVKRVGYGKVRVEDAGLLYREEGLSTGFEDLLSGGQGQSAAQYAAQNKIEAAINKLNIVRSVGGVEVPNAGDGS